MRRRTIAGRKQDAFTGAAKLETVPTGGNIARRKITSLRAGALMSATTMTAARAADGVVGVSWSNFQEERWKTDEAAIKSALEAAGAKYISADAQSSSAKQLSDVEALIAQGANALIILAQDAQAIGPAVQAASDEGIPVVGYDRLIDDSRAFYLTFDNVEVGRMQAAEVLAAAPKGDYVMIKGSPTDPNADFLRGGQQEVLQAAQQTLTVIRQRLDQLEGAGDSEEWPAEPNRSDRDSGDGDPNEG